jgi:hypothetical protein
MLSPHPGWGGDAGDRGIDGGAEPLDDDLDIGVIDDEGWGEEDMIAMAAVDRATHWVDHQATRHGFLFNAGVEPDGGIEWLFRCPVDDQFEASEETAPAQVADMAMISKALPQSIAEINPHGLGIGKEAIPPDNVLDRQRRGRGHRMAHIGVAVLEEAGSVRECVEDAL